MPLLFDLLACRSKQTALYADLRVRDGDTVVMAEESVRLDSATERTAFAQRLAAHLDGNGRPLVELEQALLNLYLRALDRSISVCLADVEPEPVSWLWPGRVPLGKITVFDGDPGIGKSLLTLDLAARVSNGQEMPDGTAGVAGGVLLLNVEDGLADTIRPRLEAAGADCTSIRTLTAVPEGDGERLPCLPDDLPLIEDEAQMVGAKLIVIDPLMAYLGAQTNSFRDQDVRRALAPLAALAERTDAAVVVVRHLNKSTTMSPLYRGGGSIGIIGAARAGLIAGIDPDDDSGMRRFFANSKSNLAPPPPPLSWTIETLDGVPVVAWGAAIDGFDLTAAMAPSPKDDAGGASAIAEAMAFLRDALASGPVATKNVQKAARDAGISGPTLRRAKDRLVVVATRDGFGAEGAWCWSLP